MARKSKSKKQRRDRKPLPNSGRAPSKAVSNAGRGFRYQDAVYAWLSVEIWTGRRASATLIPEGGDDAKLHGEETCFVKIKCRRGQLGDYTKSETARHVEELWSRSLGISPQPERLEIVLEQNVAGLDPLPEQPANRSVEGLVDSGLSSFSGVSDLLPKTSIIVCDAPQEQAVRLISDRLNCSMIAAQMCFAALLSRIGVLADANSGLEADDYCGLSVSDTEATIRDAIAAVDVEAIESVVREGICEPVDFLTPLDDPNFYLGVDVEPGHLAAGLVSERPRCRLALAESIEECRAAMIVGPSGAGKSALMWEAANTLRHTVRWFRFRRLTTADIPSVRQLIRTCRASEDSPLGFVMDDVGRNGPESWQALVKEAMAVPGVVLLGSAREEDEMLIADRARAAEVRADPDDELAERLWHELREAKKTEFLDWREPWKRSGGLLLEYVHILTSGQSMHELLANQVKARIEDPERSLELEILQSCAWAGVANAEVDASQLARELSVSEADLSLAQQRLIREHLIRSPAPGTLAGVHRLRSEELWKLTHQTPSSTFKRSFGRTVTCVSAADLEPLAADALSMHRLTVKVVLDFLNIRVERDPDARALASALKGLGVGNISAGIDEWMETPEFKAIPQTKARTAAIFAISEFNQRSIAPVPEVRAAVKQFGLIKSSPANDPRYLLVGRMYPFTLINRIKTADLASLDKILETLVGGILEEEIRTALMRVPTNLVNADLPLLESVIGNLSEIDREIAIHWIAEVGQEALFAKIQNETPWAGSVTTRNADDEVIVSCDLWYVGGYEQVNPRDAALSLCKLMLALCPSADASETKAFAADGELTSLVQTPLAIQWMRRENFTAPSFLKWDSQWIDQISRRVAPPSRSGYRAKGVAILETLVSTLEKLFDLHLRGKAVPDRLVETLSSLESETSALAPTPVSSFEAPNIGTSEVKTAATKLYSLLHNASIDIVERFGKLPEDAVGYIAWLNDMIAEVDALDTDKTWHSEGVGPPPILSRLRPLLETLRLLAGEAYERQERPVETWASRGRTARRGNAMRSIASAIKSVEMKRLAKRKAEIEQAAGKAGINADFHLRINFENILPWPPADVLALLPTTDIAGAAAALSESAEKFQVLAESSNRPTIMPMVDGTAFPALAKSVHDILIPDFEGAVAWAEYLGLPYAPSETAGLFRDVLSLSSELGAMEQKGFGNESRPEQEVFVRRRLSSTFATKNEELTRRIDAFNLDLRTEVSSLIEKLQTGDIDFVEEALSATDGDSTETSKRADDLTMIFIESEWLVGKQ